MLVKNVQNIFKCISCVKTIDKPNVIDWQTKVLKIGWKYLSQELNFQYSNVLLPRDIDWQIEFNSKIVICFN